VVKAGNFILGTGLPQTLTLKVALQVKELPALVVIVIEGVKSFVVSTDAEVKVCVGKESFALLTFDCPSPNCQSNFCAIAPEGNPETFT
jgi:hypothetical protein